VTLLVQIQRCNFHVPTDMAVAHLCVDRNNATACVNKKPRSIGIATHFE
jgi:hypothetical protein